MAGTGWLGYLAKGAILQLAGKTTLAELSFAFLGNVNVSTSLAWGAGIAGVTFGGLQRRLKKKTVERLHERIRKFEEQLDPGRSSSHLTPRGETNPEDMI